MTGIIYKDVAITHYAYCDQDFINSGKSLVKIWPPKGPQFSIQIIHKEFAENLFSGIRRPYVTNSPNLKDVTRWLRTFWDTDIDRSDYSWSVDETREVHQSER